MASADWSIALGVLVFIIAIIFAVYFYLTYKKISLVIFISAISTYIFAVFYTWDVFELNKNLVLLLLTISTVLMIFVGSYFSKIKYIQKNKK
ncbi:MAG: hypothetical protein ACOCP8_04615 [archaeon]